MKGAKAAASKVPLGSSSKSSSKQVKANKRFEEDKSKKSSGAAVGAPGIVEEEKRSFRGVPRDDLSNELQS